MNLNEFIEDDDPQKWWRLSSGQHQNLFDEALDRICENELEIDMLKDEIKYLKSKQ